jgi:hypothetical protein
LSIEVKGTPNQRYHVEFFGNRNASSSEAEQYLGSMVVMTNAQGVAKANWKPKTVMPLLQPMSRIIWVQLLNSVLPFSSNNKIKDKAVSSL